MATLTKTKITCPECDESFEVEAYDYIDAALDSDLMAKIKDCSLFVWECPHCHKKVFNFLPFIYEDKERKFIIKQDSPITNFEYFWNKFNLDDNSDKSRFTNHLRYKNENNEEYRVVGVSNPLDFFTVLNSLENNFDYRIISIMLDAAVRHVKNDKKYIGKELDIIDARFQKIDFGYEFFIVIHIDEKEYQEEHIEFSEKDYQKLAKTYTKYLDQVYSSTFIRKSFGKLIYLFKDKRAKYRNLYFAKGTLSTGLEILTIIPDMLLNKVSKSSEAVILYDGSFFKITLDEIHHCSELQFPIDINTMPIVVSLFRQTPICVTNTGKINNSFIDDLCKEDNRGDKTKIVDVIRKHYRDINVYLPIYQLDEPLKRPPVFVNMDEQFKGLTNLSLFPNDSHLPYIETYLSPEDAKSEKGAIGYIETTLNNLSNYVISCGTYFKGILFIVNEKVYFLYKESIPECKAYSIMQDTILMQEYLKSLTSDELAYLTPEYFGIIENIYFNPDSLEKYAEEHKIPKNKIEEMFMDSYKCMTDIIVCRDMEDDLK